MRRRRFCKCKCGQPLTGKQRLWASEGCRKAFERGRAPANADRARTRHTSGPQVSYLKTAKALRERPDDDPVAVITDCLPVRQRERLDELQAKSKQPQAVGERKAA